MGALCGLRLGQNASLTLNNNISLGDLGEFGGFLVLSNLILWKLRYINNGIHGTSKNERMRENVRSTNFYIPIDWARSRDNAQLIRMQVALVLQTFLRIPSFLGLPWIPLLFFIEDCVIFLMVFFSLCFSVLYEICTVI